MSNYLNIFIFCFTFLSITFWVQITLFLSSLGSFKNPQTTLYNQKLLSLVLSKTGYQLDKIFLVNSKKLFGMMPSFIKPHLILSQELYTNFDDDETEYVLLHEMAHFLLHHVFKEELLGIFLLIAGITITIALNFTLLSSILLGFIFGVTMIRFGRLHEYEADDYSLSRMTNPSGMITATKKFQAQYGSPRNKLLEALFYRGNLFGNRIKMAETEISKRQLTHKTIP